MIIGRIQGATRVLGAPPGWNESREDQCGALAILDVPAEQGGPAMVSAWHPTPAEVALMASGQPVYLWVWGSGHPPVALTVPEL